MIKKPILTFNETFSLKLSFTYKSFTKTGYIMYYIKTKHFIIILFISSFLIGCSSTKRIQKKCNGEKGVKTRMGTM